MIEVAARGLGPLKEDVVFVGGATIELYLAGQPTMPVRPTDDVDCIVEVTTRIDYHLFEEKLRTQGFKHANTEAAPICRWRYEDVIVDVMPIETAVLGFTNRWYRQGFQDAVYVKLPDGQTIKILPLPYLIASKTEAFHARGREDFIGSRDMEDIVTLVDGVDDLAGKLSAAPAEVRVYLVEQFRRFLADERFLDAVETNLPPAAGPNRPERARAILGEFCAHRP